jgi:two-component system sensor histidine kinase AlgZ
MHAPSTPPRRHALRVDVAVVLLFWGLVLVALALSRSLDLQRAGKAEGFLSSLAVMAPMMLPQIGFSLLVAVLLHRHAHWLLRPARLMLASLASIPVYLLVATPLVVGLGLLSRGKPLAGFAEEFAQWSAVNVWIDAMTASAGLALQIGIAFWRHAQAQREATLQAQADNLGLRLSLLQGQLEPHFLFNTLNGIAALVRGAERSVALQALNRLSELLRYSLRASQQRFVSVDDELRFIADYVALQRLRFGEALVWEQQIEPADWARWACPPLLLQPLVENAIRHGLEAGLPGPLQFRVRREAQSLCVELRNPRADDSELMAGHGVGLAKSRERLAVLYGERAGIVTEVLPDAFHLRLSLPLENLDATLERTDR